MIYHVIANPLLPTRKEYCTDYFTMLCIKFCDMMIRKGHTIYFYGIEKEYLDVKATKYITTFELKDYDSLKDMSNNYTSPYLLCFNHDVELDKEKNKFITSFITKTTFELMSYHKKGDLVIHTLDFCQSYPDFMTHVVLSHGGGFLSSKHAVFMTHAWRDYMKSEINKKTKTHTVIYPWFGKDEVDFNENITREPNSFLYLARCQISKGIGVFLYLSLCYPQYKFYVAGGCKFWDKKTTEFNTGEKNGKYFLKNYKNVEYLGKIGIKEKKKLLQRVTALIQPSLYYEPGGSNVMEASLCGTPVIAPNAGGFTNTVVNGRTGVLYNNVDNIRDCIPKVFDISGKD